MDPFAIPPQRSRHLVTFVVLIPANIDLKSPGGTLVPIEADQVIRTLSFFQEALPGRTQHRHEDVMRGRRKPVFCRQRREVRIVGLAPSSQYCKNSPV